MMKFEGIRTVTRHRDLYVWKSSRECRIIDADGFIDSFIDFSRKAHKTRRAHV